MAGKKQPTQESLHLDRSTRWRPWQGGARTRTRAKRLLTLERQLKYQWITKGSTLEYEKFRVKPEQVEIGLEMTDMFQADGRGGTPENGDNLGEKS